MKVLGVNVVFPLLGFYCHGAFLINVEQESELWKGAYCHIRSHKSRTTRWLLACSAPWHSRPITSSGGRGEISISNLPEECDAICFQVWLIPAEESQPYHTSERRQKITEGAGLSLSDPPLLFTTKFFLHLFHLMPFVGATQSLFGYSLSVCNGTPQGPFPLAIRSESLPASEAKTAFKDTDPGSFLSW